MRSSQLRIASGRFATALWSIVEATSAWLVWRSRVASVTVIDSCIWPTESEKSSLARWPTSRMTARFWVPKLWASACTV